MTREGQGSGGTGTVFPSTPGFDASLAGQEAECDGGHALAGTNFAGRQDFAGRLTGDYVDHGDPPWRWYLLGDLTLRPQGYLHDTVWCESGNLFVDSPMTPEPPERQEPEKRPTRRRHGHPA